MADNPVDVAIVGAGAAGLQAADVLSAMGTSVVVLEGRDRIGGRIETLHDPAWPLPIERGAEFVHGKPRETWDILRASGCPAYDIAESNHVFSRGKLAKHDEFFEQVEEALEIVKKVRGKDMTFDECAAKYAPRMNKRLKAWTRMYVEGFNAADASVISAQWLAESARASEEIEGDRIARIYEGYERITNFLRTGIAQAAERIRLGTTVTAIRWGRDDGVVIDTRSKAGATGVLRANKVIVTAPVGVLQLPPGETGYIAFDPDLPATTRAAIGQLKMGPVVKVVLHCHDAFWEKIDADMNFFHAPESSHEEIAFPTWWTTLPVRTSVLTGWAGGPAAAALSGRPAGEVLQRAQRALSTLLKVSMRKLQAEIRAAHVCDWQSEPLSRGAYSYAAAGGIKAARTLSKPLNGRLFFAGEATEPGLTGTVAAALASGHRVAKQVLQARE